MSDCRTAAVLAFTKGGMRLGTRLSAALENGGVRTECHAPARLADGEWCAFSSLSECVGALMERMEALIFIGAAGIAVRAAAPFLQDKLTDPAVLVLDEQAHFVIPLLSGHAGGANALALRLAELVGAQPVLTTATDVRGEFSVDSYARSHRLSIVEKDEIRHISGALLDGEPVGALTPESGFVISPNTGGRPFSHTLHLVPQDLIVGMGCRSGVPGEELFSFIQEQFSAQGWSLYRIRALASIDRKKDEAGLIALANRLHVPFLTYPAEMLAAQRGTFHSSDFVQRTVGVDNVCERSALCAAVSEGWLDADSSFDVYVRLRRQSCAHATLAVLGLY